jgi:hypothetical protein
MTLSLICEGKCQVMHSDRWILVECRITDAEVASLGSSRAPSAIPSVPQAPPHAPAPALTPKPGSGTWRLYG